MENGRYRKVRSVENHLDCKSCPMKLQRATILYDQKKNLPLLQIILENRGQRDVSAVYLKLIYYDNYGNIVPDNGRDYRIWGFLNLDCPPGETRGSNKVILLPADDVFDCDVFVTKVLYSDGETLQFSESDYRVRASELRQSQPVKKSSRSIFIVGAAAAVLVTGLLIWGGVAIAKGSVDLFGGGTPIEEMIEKENYEGAYQKARKKGDTLLCDQISRLAFEKAMGEGDLKTAGTFALRNNESDQRLTLAGAVVQSYLDQHRFEEAEAYADDSGENQLYAKAILGAAEYYCGVHDFNTAIEYAGKLHDLTKTRDVYDQAINYYVSLDDYTTALEFALKTGDLSANNAVYESAILKFYQAGDYNTAALYIAKSGGANSGVVSQILIEQIYALADERFIRTHLTDFYPTFSLTRKQALFSQIIDVYKEPVGITKTSRVAGTVATTWSGVASIQTSEFHTVGLCKNGTVVACGDNTYQQCATSGWTDITAIAAGEFHTVAVRADGTVLAAGRNDKNQCKVSSWRGIVEVAAGNSHTVGLKSDGTCVACGSNEFGQCDVSQWTDIIAIACGDNHTVGLKSDRTVVATGNAMMGRCAVSGWTDIVAIDAGDTMTVGLHSGGTVVMTGHPAFGTCGDVSAWTDIKAIAAGSVCVMGLKEDGSIVITGSGAPKVSSMLNLRQPYSLFGSD